MTTKGNSLWKLSSALYKGETKSECFRALPTPANDDTVVQSIEIKLRTTDQKGQNKNDFYQR